MPMPDFSYRDPTEALREIFSGEFTFGNLIRDTAAKEIRQIARDRIYSGRRPQNISTPWLDISIAGVERRHNLDGESSCAIAFIQVNAMAKDRVMAYRLFEAVRQAISGMRATVKTREGDVEIQSCTIESDSEPDPETPIDASEEFTYEYGATFRVQYKQIVAQGTT